MHGKAALLAAIAVICIFAVPSFSTAAEWTKNGEALKTEDHVLVEGTAAARSQLGLIHCKAGTTVTIKLWIFGITTVKSLVQHEPLVNCQVTEFLKSVCGEKSLTEVKLEGEPTGTPTAGKKLVDFSGVKLIYKFGSCLTLTLTGSITMDLDSETAIKTGTLTGELAGSGGFGNFKMEGTLNVTPSGVYGVK